MKIRNHLDFAASARAINLLDPTSAQDAATKAYVDGRGWTQIGSTVNTTSGSSAAFTAIPAIWSDLLLVVEGISHNSGSNQSIRLELSDDGTNWTAPISISDVSFAAAGTQYGAILLAGYRMPAGSTVGSLSNLTANRTAAASIGGINWRIAAGLQALRVSVSGGTLDAGMLKLFGR